MQATGRGVLMSCGEPLRIKLSGKVYRAEQDAVVCARRSSCERVTDSEELVGRLRTGSRFPQYLDGMNKRKARSRGGYLLYDGNVDWRSRASTVDGFGIHRN